MLLPSRPVTEKQVAANQGNSKKSTGPTTERGKRVSSQNGFKHGFYAQLPLEVMAALREDPVERLRILKGLQNTYKPRNDGQEMAVEDISWLRWRRRQLERSQAARMGERVNDLDVQRELFHLQINQDVADVSQEEVLEKGLRNIQDSPGKFEELLAKLKALIKQVKNCDYTSALPYLTAIYAKQASYRGATIFNLFLDRMRLAREREEALKHRRPWPPPGDEVWQDEDAPTADDEPGYDPRLDLPSDLLLMKLNQELHDVARLYDIFIREKVTVSQTKRDAAIAPDGPVDWYLARELWMIDRQIDAKTRLFMKMRVDDRNWRLTEEQDDADDSEAGSNGARPEADSGPDETRKAEGRRQNAEGGVRTAAEPEPDETVAAREEPTVAGPPAPADSAGRKQADDSASHPERRVEGCDDGSAMRIPALLMLACLLGFMLGVRTRSAAGIPPQLQAYLRGPRVRALECGSAATALAPVAALQAKRGNAATALGTVAALRAKAALRPEGGSSAAALQGGLGSQSPTDDDFNRTEATDLLKTKDRDPGPNPIRTHFGEGEGKVDSRR